MKSPAFKNQPGNSSLVWDYSPALPGTARFGRCAAGASVVGHRTHSSHVCLPSPASAVLGRCLRHRCRRTVLHTCTCGTPSCVRCRTGARVPAVPWTAKDAVQCSLAHEYLRYLRRQAVQAMIISDFMKAVTSDLYGLVDFDIRFDEKLNLLLK